MKTVLLALLILTALTVLTGCATQAQRQAQQMQEQLKIADQAAMSCMKPVYFSAPGNRLNERFIFTAADPRTVEKLTIKGYATEQEIKDMLEYAALRTPCNTLAIREYGKAHSEYGIFTTKASSEMDEDVVKAIKKEITVAEFNQRTLDRINRYLNGYSQIQGRIYSQLNESHQQEIAQRQRAAEARQRWNYQQQVLAIQRQALNIQRQKIMNQSIQPILKRPEKTTCHFVGNEMHCTTR